MLNDEFEYWYLAEVVSIHDGDTMTLKIDMGKRVYTLDAIRLIGINAPELSQAGGKEARDFLRNLCPIGSKVRIRTFKNKNDKYGRWLGRVYLYSQLFETPLDVNQHMVDSGHASEWN